MKNLKSVLGAAGMLALSVFMVACSSDDEPSYSTSAVTNSELATILKSKGYQLNEQGQLLLDDKAQQTTTLDLSGTNIPADALAELSILPNLTEVDLSDNGYGPAFDFSTLPAQITGVDLTGNEIYDYDNLVSVEVAENGDETVTMLHNITKLYLPAEAKDNIKQLMRFYRENKTAIEDGTMDVQMVNASGTLEKYTTLRSVPDENLLSYLQTNFSDILEDNQIDISKRLGLEQKGADLTVLPANGVENFEGIQYLIGSPYWEGVLCGLYAATGKTDVTVPNLEIGSNVTRLALSGISISELDLTECSNLYSVNLSNVSKLETLDLSNSTVFAQREKEVEGDNMTGTSLFATDCSSLKEIVLPSKSDLKFYKLDIECLPALETFDMSKISMVRILVVGDMADNINLTYPTLSIFYKIEGSTQAAMQFACSEKTFNLETTKAFLQKYYTNASDDEKITYLRSMTSKNNKGYNWKKYL